MVNRKLILIMFTAVVVISAGFGFGRQKEGLLIDGWEFPKEEGAHQNLQIEWWYFAGHLEEEGNPENKFGATLMFHKNPASITVNLTDGVEQKNFSSKIYIDNYDILPKEKLTIKKGDNYWLEQELFKYKIHFGFEDKEINLNLDAIKNPFIRYNTNDAFYYYQTRVKLSGQLSFPENQYKVKGWGWIDHQGFGEPLSWKSWRWHAIQLDNNTEIVFTTVLTSKLNKIDKKELFIFNGNQKEVISGDDYSIEDLDYWVDPETDYQYPVKLRLKIPDKNTNLEITAIVKDQVIDGTSGLYEGSCQVTGIFEGQAITGRAQLEINP